MEDKTQQGFANLNAGTEKNSPTLETIKGLTGREAIQKLFEEAQNITKGVDFYHYGEKKGQVRRCELNDKGRESINFLSQKLANAPLAELLAASEEIQKINQEEENTAEEKALIRSIRGVIETRIRYKVNEKLENKPKIKARLLREVENIKKKRQAGDKSVSTMDIYIKYAKEMVKTKKPFGKGVSTIGRYAAIILTALSLQVLPVSQKNPPYQGIEQVVEPMRNKDQGHEAEENLEEITLGTQDHFTKSKPQQDVLSESQPDQTDESSTQDGKPPENILNERINSNTQYEQLPDMLVRDEPADNQPQLVTETKENKELVLDEFDLKQTGRISREKIIEILHVYNADYADKENLADFFLEMEKKYGIGAEYLLVLAIQETRLGNDIATGRANLAGKNNWFNYGKRDKQGKFPDWSTGVKDNIETAFWQLARYRNEWGKGERPPHIPKSLWREIVTFEDALKVFAPEFENPNLEARIENAIKFIRKVRDVEIKEVSTDTIPQEIEAEETAEIGAENLK